MTYVADKPVSELTPVQALALVNRWAKLKEYFWYDDKDALYDLKDRKIAEWVTSNEMIPTFIIRRESPVFAAMREQIANHGADLDTLGYCDTPDDWNLTDEELKFYQILVDFCCNSDYEVSFPEDIIERRQADYKNNLNIYLELKKLHDDEIELRQPAIDEYNQLKNQWSNRKAEAAKKWAKENNKQIARSNSGKSLKKDWIERLERQGFKFDEKSPTHPFSRIPLTHPCPKQPHEPELTYTVEPETYIPGSIQEIEDAINWAKNILGEVPDYHDLSEDFVYHTLDSALREMELEKTKVLVLNVFQQVIKGEIIDPKHIYSELTKYAISYETLGMNDFTDRWGNTDHADFSKWHEINLSRTGYWLIEFQSLVDSTITFHVPYDRRNSLLMKFDWNSLPIIDGDRECYGREITITEQQDYPLTELVRILDVEPEDFPHQLEKYSKYRCGYRFYQHWDEEDDDMNEFDEDEWI
ncbi:MAG: hypothetical protein SAL70_30720 [Scytonema sp. PMC 1070.18]|nr:hypothetical protein [Scytonema sp. PMC 1070.18]